MSKYSRMINVLVLVALAVAAYFLFSSRGDYGPPPDDPWFRQAVLEQSGPVLVKFGADWCGPCQMLDAELTQLERSCPARVVKIDIEERPHLARHYRVSPIPRVLLFKDGEVVGDRTGYAPAEELRKWIASRAG